MSDGNGSDGESRAAPADLQEFVDETEKFSPVFKTTMEELADDWRAAAAGNDHVTFPAPFDEAEDVRKAWGARSEFVRSVRQAFIDADSYDPGSPGEVFAVPTSAIDAVLNRTAEKLIELGVDPDDAEKIAAGSSELFDAVVNGEIEIDAAVEVAGLPDGEQRNVLSTDLTSEEIVEVLDGDYGKGAKSALTEGHGYRVRLLMLDEEARASVQMSDTLPIILGEGEDHLSFEEIQKRVAEERARIVEEFQTKGGMSYDEAQAAYDDLQTSVEFLAENKDARMALDGGADEDSKPGDPDADNRYAVADAQARAIQLLEEADDSNGRRLWQRSMQGRMGTPPIYVVESDETVEDAEALIDDHRAGSHDQFWADQAAAEVQAKRREDPEAAAELEIAVVRLLEGEERAAFIEQMNTQSRQEQMAFAILGEGIDRDVEIDPADVDAETQRILDESTKPFTNPPPDLGGDGKSGERFDANEAEYQINELAKTDPLLAVMVKQQLDGQLTPDEVAEFNRLIAEPGFVDGIESSLNHPEEAPEGVGKWVGNQFIFAGNVFANGMRTSAEVKAEAIGVDPGPRIEDPYPEFEYDNSAQQGAANIATLAEIALGGKGLVKIGGKWFIRVGNKLKRVPVTRKAADLAELNAKRGKAPQPGKMDEVFTGENPSTVDDIVAQIPTNATVRRLSPSPGGSQVGVEYRWVDETGDRNIVRIHGPDPSAPARSNAADGWIVRWRKASRYYDPETGKFARRNVHNPNSPHHDPAAANNTHIPVETPDQNVVDSMSPEKP